MKPIRECDREERMFRVLLLLDAMTFALDDVMSATPRQVEEFVRDIYKIAHAAHGACCVQSEAWLDRIDSIANHLEKHNVIHVDKIVEEFQAGKRPKKPDPQGLLHAIESAEATK